VLSGRGDITFVRDWLSRLVALNECLYPFGAEPYFLQGLNLHCWLDICFDDLFDFDLFGDIRRFIHDNLDLAPLAHRYTPVTGLKEKVDKIVILSSLLECGDPTALRTLLLSIRDDYPLTGTYFYEEAAEMLRVVEGAGLTDAT
jgi:hypothetical protein